MHNTALTTWRLQRSMAVNRFVYRLQHLPLVGKKVPSSLYRGSEIKSLFSALSLISHILSGFVKKAIYLAAFIYLPAQQAMEWLFPEQEGLSLTMVFLLFFCMNLLAGSFVNSTVLNVTEDKYVILNLMRADAKNYYLQQILLKLAGDTLFFLPGLIVALCVLGKLSLWVPLALLLELIAFRVIGEALGLWLYDKKDFNIAHTGKVGLPILGVSLPAAAGLIYLCRGIPTVGTVGTHPITVLVVLIVCLPALRYLLGFGGYTYVARQTATYSVVMQGILAVQDAGKSGSAVDEKAFGEKDLHSNKFEKLHGYDYLNALFFDRNKRQYRVLWRIKIIAITVLTIGGCVAGFFLLNTPGTKVSTIMPALVFILYLMCSGQRVCRSLFYNCDVCLLKYGYYRQGDALLQNFRIRLRRLVWMDMVPALLLCAGIVLFIFSIRQPWQLVDCVPMLLTIPLLSIFFDIYQLLLYYIFQPYLEAGGQKSVGYSVFSMLIYVAAYACLQVHTDSIWFTLSIMALTVVVIPVSYALIYRLAPKCFHLK